MILRRSVAGFAVFLFALGAGVFGPGAEAGYENGVFTESFDGAPASPQPYSSNTVAVSQTHRNLTGDTVGVAHAGHHGADCSPPMAMFANDGSRAMAAWQCRDHLMTSFAGTPYGVIYLSPAAMVDWTNGPATVRWAQSTARSSARDFLGLWITPWVDRLDMPAPAVVDNDLNGAPLNAIHIEMDLFTDRITPELYHGGSNQPWYNETTTPYTNCVSPSASRRDLFELTITASTLYLTVNGCTIMTASGLTAPFTKGVLQFGHHSYSPGKGCGTGQAAVINPCVNGDDVASANTWHWDDFFISPALPLSFLAATPDYIDQDGGVLTLPAPAPAGSMLSFTAIGRVELSWDGGQSWHWIPVQTGNRERDPFHISNYWTPIPEGQTVFQARFNSDGGYPAEMMHGKDFTAWTQGLAPSPTPTATATPSPTPTASPATATATPSPTATISPTSTPSPAPTALPTPTPTLPTPTPTTVGGCGSARRASR